MRKEDQMRAESPSGRRTRRHPPIGWIVLGTILLLAIAEPFVMYRSLVREREQRQEAMAQTLQLVPDLPARSDAGR
jgi:hypothetical protein